MGGPVEYGSGPSRRLSVGGEGREGCLSCRAIMQLDKGMSTLEVELIEI